MTLKSDLIKRIVITMTQRYPTLTEKAVNESVQTLLETITTHLAQGGRLEIRGFGSLSSEFFPSRISRNPLTGNTVQMSARYRLRFKAAKQLRLRLNPK